MGEKRSSKTLNPACAYARAERERQRKKNLLKKKKRRETATSTTSVPETSCATWISSKSMTASQTPAEPNVLKKDKDFRVQMNPVRSQYLPTVVTKSDRVILPAIEVNTNDDDSDSSEDTTDTEDSSDSTTNAANDINSISVKQNVISSLKEQVVSRMNIIKAKKDIPPPPATLPPPPEEEDEEISPEIAARLQFLRQNENKPLPVNEKIRNLHQSSASALNNNPFPILHASFSSVNEYQCHTSNASSCHSGTLPNDSNVSDKTILTCMSETLPNSVCPKFTKSTLFVPTSLRLQNKPKVTSKITNGKPFRFGTGASLAESAKSVNKAMVSSSFSKPILAKPAQVEDPQNLEAAFQNFMNDITKSLE